jgi:hypothetical protein
MDEAELILESLRRSGIRVSDVGGKPDEAVNLS